MKQKQPQKKYNGDVATIFIVILIVLGGLIFTVVMLKSIISIANGEANWGSETFKMWLFSALFYFAVLFYWLDTYFNDIDNQ